MQLQNMITLLDNEFHCTDRLLNTKPNRCVEGLMLSVRWLLDLFIGHSIIIFQSCNEKLGLLQIENVHIVNSVP